MSDAKNKLSLAAEALVEAATLEAVEKKVGNENLACFEDLKAEISKLHDNINGVNHNLNGINNIMEQQIKLQKLSNAIANAHVGLFSYNDGYCSANKNSKEFVQGILQSFVNGVGHYIPRAYYITTGYDRDNQTFRAELKAQVKLLIGREPRLVQASNGQYAIYYS